MDHERWSEAQERTTVAVDGHELDLAYRDAGSGEPVLFLHGIPTWSFLWRQVALRLEGQFRTIVPDFVGYGNSDRREGFDRSIRAQEQVLAGLVDELELDRFHVVSHDIGGGVALRYGAHTDGRIDRLVCSNATCYGSWPVGYIVDLGLPRTAEMNSEEFRDELDEAFLGGLEREEPDPEWTAGIEAPWLRPEGQRAFARAAVATNTNHTTEISYGEIDAELLCLWGAADAEQPIEDGKRLIEDIGGECVGLEDAGHWVMEDRPEAFTEHVERFLTEG
jgi:pimeloyl-ACP methyl ester carboxylesterase